MKILIEQIIASAVSSDEEVFDLARARIKKTRAFSYSNDMYIYKRSVDARHKESIKLVYTVCADVETIKGKECTNLSKFGIKCFNEEAVEFEFNGNMPKNAPLIVGFGPCGMFCALGLARAGLKPIVIERGADVDTRVKCVDEFYKSKRLTVDTNIQFGAGGAGTFSDGKLLTRINDPKINYVLKRFCDFGAPSEILTSAKPHIGTDLLLGIVDAMLAKIERLGGSVLYRTRLDRITELSNGTVCAHTTAGDIKCSALVLATGHSARDTYKMLIENGYVVEAKDFSVGVRIEHLRENIDKALYGDMAGHEKLGKGEYHLSDTTGERGVYTFCMCPGGEVVAAASEEGGVVVNGMSRNARDGKNSNSAIAVSVKVSDYGATPADAIAFQRKIERAAFLQGGGNYFAPIQTVGDFLEGRVGKEPSDVLPSYRNGCVKIADMNSVLPEFVCEGLKRGIVSFDKKLSGFSVPSAILTGVETRTSAPVRIMRNEELVAIAKGAVYPCGEGAGYAGGITSAAIDGIRVAIKIMSRFAPVN